MFLCFVFDLLCIEMLVNIYVSKERLLCIGFTARELHSIRSCSALAIFSVLFSQQTEKES